MLTRDSASEAISAGVMMSKRLAQALATSDLRRSPAAEDEMTHCISWTMDPGSAWKQGRGNWRGSWKLVITSHLRQVVGALPNSKPLEDALQEGMRHKFQEPAN